MLRKGFYILLLSVVIPQVLCNEDANAFIKYHTVAFPIGNATFTTFSNMFSVCAHMVMPSQHYLLDDLRGFVNYPSKTTVGFGPKYSKNRKFFANMISSVNFKDMMEHDAEELRKDFVKKLKYCDSIVMDENILKDLYDRDVDQSKL